MALLSPSSRHLTLLGLLSLIQPTRSSSFPGPPRPRRRAEGSGASAEGGSRGRRPRCHAQTVRFSGEPTVAPALARRESAFLSRLRVSGSAVRSWAYSGAARKIVEYV